MESVKKWLSERAAKKNGLYVHYSPPKLGVVSAAQLRAWARGPERRLERAALAGHGRRLLAEAEGLPLAHHLRVLVHKCDSLHNAVEKGSLLELQELLEADYNRKKFVTCRDEAGVGLLHKAVYYDFMDIAEYLVKNYPQLVHMKDSEGRTPLHYAALCRDEAGAACLLEGAGGARGARDAAGRTPAAYRAAGRALLVLPAPPADMTKENRNPPGLVIKRHNIRIWCHDCDMSRLQRVVWEGHGTRLLSEVSNQPVVKKFLEAVPYIMNTIRDIHQAVVDNDLEALMKHSGDPVPPQALSSRDVNNMTVIHKAAGLGHGGILKYLVERYPQGVNDIDNDGRTPLHYAATMRDEQHTYNTLVSLGADESVVDNKNKTPAYYVNRPQEIDKNLFKTIPDAPRTPSSAYPPSWDWKLLDNYVITDSNKKTRKKNFRASTENISSKNNTNTLSESTEHQGKIGAMKASSTHDFIKDLPELDEGNQISNESEKNEEEKQKHENSEETKVEENEGPEEINAQESGNAVDNNEETTNKTEAVEGTVNNENSEETAKEENTEDENAGKSEKEENTEEPPNEENPEQSSKEENTEEPPNEENPEQSSKEENTEEPMKEENSEETAIKDSDDQKEETEINESEQDRKETNSVLTPAEEDIVDTQKESDVTKHDLPDDHNDASERPEENENEIISSNHYNIEDVGVKENGHAESNLSDKTEHNTDNVESLGELDDKCEESPVDQQINIERNGINDDEVATNMKMKNEDDDTPANEGNNNSSVINEDDDDVQIPGDNSSEYSDYNLKSTAEASDTGSAKIGHESNGRNTQENLIEGIISGEAEQDSQDASISQKDESVHGEVLVVDNEIDPEVTDLINTANMEMLATLVLNGEGSRLIGRRSGNSELQGFLDNVPSYMQKINQVHVAARGGNLKDLQSALDRRKFAIARDPMSPNGATPMHVATVFGKTNIMKYLGSRFPETLSAVDFEGRTALHYAAALPDNGHYYNLLQQLGANAKDLDDNGRSAEDYFKNPNLLPFDQLLSDFGLNDDAVKNMFSDKGPTYPDNGHMDIPIFQTEEGRYLAKSLGDPLIKGLTEVASVKPKDPVAFLASFLHNFPEHEKPRMESPQVQESNIIVAQEAEVENEQVPESLVAAPVLKPPRSASHTATRPHRPIDVVTVDPQTVTSPDAPETAFSSAKRDEHGQSMLHFAAARTHARNALFQLLQESDVSLGYRDELYRTARDVSTQANVPENTMEIDRFVLHLAARGQTDKIMELLMEGYDHILDVVDEEGASITDVIAQRGDTEMSNLLASIPSFEESRDILFGAVRRGDLQAVKESLEAEGGRTLVRSHNSFGRTALHTAVLGEHEEIVAYLAQNYPELLRIGDNLERTPLHYAMGVQKIESLSRVLIRAGAKRVLKDLKGRQPSYYFMNKSDILRLQEEEEIY